MRSGQSRRQFLRNVGLGTGALMLANAGLPLGMVRAGGLQSAASAAAAAVTQGTAGAWPQVELICGDVVGFALESQDWEGDFGWVTFQTHRALYEGDEVHYIRTDASDETFAQENFLVYVPLLNAALAAEGATSQLYTFDNGVDGQYPVVSHIPDQDEFSPAWHVRRVTFNGAATLLDSVEAIRAAEADGDVTVEALNLVVNFPLVKWPGGELPPDTELREYLGTGPLTEPVDAANMRVSFKLHECYPGSRYIITDTSAVPMAPMMGIVGSAATQQLARVGATDRIWVFGNGIPGSGVMGYQPAIFGNPAGHPVWSPFWEHFTAVWNDDSDAVLLTTADELRAREDQLTIYKGVPDMDQDMPAFVVNCPVPVKARNTFTP
jgi:hypothetical protein